MIAEKNGITVDTRTAAPARKMIKCPQKTGINLNLQEDRQRDRRTLLIGILAIAALVTVVVNFGVLQQYGTPAEVYDDPVNEFVASFIGDPPMNILEIAIRPTSLCMRLFGNVLGAFVIMELIKLVVPVFVPAVFSLYFDLFDGLIQTYVFVFLTSLFMKESIGGEE